MKNKLTKYKILMIFVLLINTLTAQNKIIIINLFNYNSEAMAHLYKESLASASSATLIDSAIVGTSSSNAGKIMLSYNLKNTKDFLSVKLYTTAQNTPFTFPVLIGKEDTIVFTIQFPVNNKNLIQHIIVKKSETNKKYYDFLQKNQQLFQKKQAIFKLASFYNNNDNFYVVLSNEMTKTNNEISDFHHSYLFQKTDDQVIHLIKDQLLMNEKKIGILDSIKDIYFINSPLFMPSIWLYSSKHINQKKEVKKQNSLLMLTIDTLNTYLQNLPLKYGEKVFKIMSNTFLKYSKEELSLYILENILPEYLLQCESPIIQNQINKIKNLIIESKVPDIKFEIANFYNKHRINSLYTLKADTVVVLFWASWCSHCQQQVPMINNLLSAHKKIKILAVSLDNDKNKWKDFISQNNLKNWMNYCDAKSWNSKIVQKYNVHATPTMFILDKNKKIIAKPLNYNALKILLVSDKK